MAQDAKAEISACNRRFEALVKEGQMEGLGRLYTEQARLLPPDARPVTGRDAIGKFWEGAAAKLGVTSIKLGTQTLDVYGDVANEVGEATIGLGAAGSATAKYIVLWRRVGGQWYLDVDIWNMTPAG